MKEEEVYNYQNHIIDLFDNVPWFMPSQIKNASFHSDYDVLRIEEKAFGLPDQYMMTFQTMG